MIFTGRKFILVPDSDLPDNDTLDIEKIITDNGGSLIMWKERLDGDVTPQLVIVSSSIDFQHYNELTNLMVPTVTSEWITLCAAEGKLLPTRPYSPDPKNFLKRAMICCAGLSSGDTDAIHAGVRAVGGDYSERLTRYTTHVITTDINQDLAEIALESKFDIKVVSPEWIDDCIKLQMEIDEKPYLMKTSTIGNSFSEQSLIGTYHEEDQENLTAPRLAVQSSVKMDLGSVIFENKRVYLGQDLEISERLQKTIVYLVEANGGKVVSSLDDATVFLGKWREGEEYTKASNARLIVGNLTWLYWMSIQQKWELPTKHLLHYPLVKQGLPGLKDAIISITNYTGDSRAYLQMLISALGAKYSGTLAENSTTHLIAATAEGPKYKAAKSWNVQVVNHLWLEETYSKWQTQSTTLPRYTHLPSKSNLVMTALIGSTHLIPGVLRKFYASKQEPERISLPTRAARNKANEILHAVMLKETEFQKQRKTRDLPLLSEELDARQEAKRPRTDDEEREDTPDAPAATDNVASPEKTPASKNTTRRTTKSPQPQVVAETTRVIVTGVEKHPSKARLQKLRLSIVDALPAKILVAPRILRTSKFLCSLAEVEACVTPEWLYACIDAKEIVGTDDYKIDSPLLANILDKSQQLRANNAGLFTGLNFWLASEVKGGVKVVEAIIKAHRGTITRKKENAIVLVADDKEGLHLDDLVNAILSMSTDELK